MPRAAPPPAPVAPPLRHELPPFTSLERIHSEKFGPADFNPTVPGPRSGGRFDSATGDYAYLYAGEDIPTAVEETLLRDVPMTAGVARQLPAVQLRGRRLSSITTARQITLTDLRGAPGLAAVGQDEWLVHCDGLDYPMTRKWAHAIRQWDHDTSGFIWKSRRNLESDAYVFFSDRLEEGSLIARIPDGMPVDVGQGRALIDEALRRASVTVT